ncbi:MAG TPA: acyl-CoA dehydrogenase family protein [Novosphingobium sp.]|nr:acyl-CoA dehydrogenase family protein [Novosphingobium sp.]
MPNTAEAPTAERHTTEHLDTEEQRAFRLEAREVMAAGLPPRIPGQSANSFEDKELVALDRASQRKLYEGGLGGLGGIMAPKEYGGLGLDKRFEDIFIEEAYPYRLPWHYGNAHNVVIPCLLAHGTEEQKKRLLPRIFSGEDMWCQMLSEPSGGSDLAGVLTRAEKRGDTWYLNGSKVWTSGGDVSDMALCLARTDPTVRKHAGLTMFLVKMRQPGMTINPIKLVRGSTEFCQEFLDDVEVPESDVLGGVNDGWTVAMTQLAAERAGMGRGWAIGLRQAALSQYVELSPQYGEMARELGLARDSYARQLIGEAFVLDAVYDLTGKRVSAGLRNGALPPTVGAVHSLLSARSSVKRTQLLSALAGPAGVASSPDQSDAVSRIGIDRVVTHRIGGGTLETQLNLVAERHLGLPREPGSDRDIPFNQLKHNRSEKLA